MKRHLTGEHLIKNHRQRVNIGAMINRQAPALFRRHVVRSAESLARLGNGRDPFYVSQPEIGQIDVIILKDNIAGLDIAVDDAPLMSVN